MPIVSWLISVPFHVLVLLITVFVLIVIRRLTASLGADIKTAKTSVFRILVMRFLLDRSYLHDQEIVSP
jgi:hypothetical protein